MAAWQHVQGLQADSTSDQHCGGGLLQPARPATAPVRCYTGASSRPHGTGPPSAVLGCALPEHIGSTSWGISSSAKDGPDTKQSWQGTSVIGSKHGGGGSAAAPSSDGLTTAAERYWRLCDRRCNSGTAAALPPLLNSLFQGLYS